MLVALLHPLAIAIGRWIFAPEMRGGRYRAAGQRSGRPAVRRPDHPGQRRRLPQRCRRRAGRLGLVHAGAAVATRPYAVGAQDHREPAGRRTAGPRLLILGVSVVALVVTGGLASYGGQARAQQITLGSPVDDLALTCASWTQQPEKKAAQTLALSGAGCSTVTAFSGFAQSAQQQLSEQFSPVRAETPDGASIKGRVVAAQYGPVVVVASTDGEGYGSAPDQLQGLRVVDGQRHLDLPLRRRRRPVAPVRRCRRRRRPDRRPGDRVRRAAVGGRRVQQRDREPEPADGQEAQEVGDCALGGISASRDGIAPRTRLMAPKPAVEGQDSPRPDEARALLPRVGSLVGLARDGIAARVACWSGPPAQRRYAFDVAQTGPHRPATASRSAPVASRISSGSVQALPTNGGGQMSRIEPTHVPLPLGRGCRHLVVECLYCWR